MNEYNQFNDWRTQEGWRSTLSLVRRSDIQRTHQRRMSGWKGFKSFRQWWTGKSPQGKAQEEACWQRLQPPLAQRCGLPFYRAFTARYPQISDLTRIEEVDTHYTEWRYPVMSPQPVYGISDPMPPSPSVTYQTITVRFEAWQDQRGNRIYAAYSPETDTVFIRRNQ